MAAGLYPKHSIPTRTLRHARFVPLRAVRPVERLAVDFLAVVFFGDRLAVVLEETRLVVAALRAVDFLAVDLAAPLRLGERLVAALVAVVLRAALPLVDRLALVFFGDRLVAADRAPADFLAVDFLAVDLVAPLRLVERPAVLAERVDDALRAAVRALVPVLLRAAMEHGSLMTFSIPSHGEAPNAKERSPKGSIGQKRPSVRR